MTKFLNADVDTTLGGSSSSDYTVASQKAVKTYVDTGLAGKANVVSTMPAASSTNLDEVVQYLGATDSTYTSGHFYRCVSDGESTPTYSWEEVDVGSYLPLTGGTITGPLKIEGYSTGLYDSAKLLTLKAKYNNSSSQAIFGLSPAAGNSPVVHLNAGMTFSGSVQPLTDNQYTLGNLGALPYRWKRAAVIRLNSTTNANNDILVPGFPGTIAIQESTMPTAAAGLENTIVQFTGTTDSTYTNGYFYKCVSDGQSEPTYSWSQVDVQPASGSALPSQTGNAGKFLTTDGTDPSWAPALTNTATGTGSVGINTTGSPSSSCNYSQNIGGRLNGQASYSVAIGFGSSASSVYAIGIGIDAGATGNGSIAIGGSTNASHAIQLGYQNSTTKNSDANTFKVGNANGNFEIMSADGTVPSDRLIHSINKYSTLPTASSTNLGWIVQYTGTTDSNYTHGYIYECTTDGSTYSWTQLNVQPAGSSLPSQTGQSGKFLTTDGTDAAWATITFPTVDQTYDSTSSNAQSGTAVAGAISSAISCVYKAAGSVTFANLPTLSSSIEGYVYDVSDSFTTTADFVEGAGNTYPAGTNVVCINTAASGQTAVYKWDVLSALADLSGYLPTTGGRMTSTLRFVNTNDTIGGGIRGSSNGGLEFAKITETGGGAYTGSTIAGLTVKGFFPSNDAGKNLGTTGYRWKTLYITKLNNGSDISVPSTGGTLALTSDIQYVQYSTVPTASSTNLNKIIQFTGTTDSTYTNGYFYKCVSDGASTPTCSWEQVNVQPGSSGSSSLADLSDTSISSPSSGQLLKYNGTAWENDTVYAMVITDYTA